MSRRIRQAVLAVIRQEETILLVQKPHPNHMPHWTLPGGPLRPGEPLEYGLRRMVREQSGLEIEGPGMLVQAVRLVDRSNGDESMTYLFEVMTWSGGLTTDGNGETFAPTCRFKSLADVVRQLQQIPEPSRREPPVAYLSGETGPGFVWLYQHKAGREELITRLRSSSLD